MLHRKKSITMANSAAKVSDRARAPYGGGPDKNWTAPGTTSMRAISPGLRRRAGFCATAAGGAGVASFIVPVSAAAEMAETCFCGSENSPRTPCEASPGSSDPVRRITAPVRRAGASARRGLAHSRRGAVSKRRKNRDVTFGPPNGGEDAAAGGSKVHRRGAQRVASNSREAER